MTDILPPPDEGFDFETEVLIIGSGAAGMIAALTAHERGKEVLILEADAVPTGSTALSAGLIPAAGTKVQKDAGIEDDAGLFADDIMDKAKGRNDPDLVRALSEGAAEVIDWLSDRHGLPFSVVRDFSYPGHSRRRMHGLPSRSGRELVDRLRTTLEAEEIPLITERRVEQLFATEAGDIRGVAAVLPDGSVERIGCKALILACNGFGGNREMVRQFMPEIGDAIYFGHVGNQGDAIRWGKALGAATDHLGAYQGHGNVAHPHGILITWAVMTEGGVQVNTEGRRFWNESQGYSEAAQAVLAQPGGVAWSIFDTRIAEIARQFADFQDAEAQGAIVTADTVEDLADRTRLPADTLAETLAAVGQGADPFGRTFDPDKRLAAPYCAVRVTGTLFHTQGGLDVAPDARVRRPDGRVFDTLFAVGGAATGVSGTGDYGYLSGNGLLAAVVLGRKAGLNA